MIRIGKIGFLLLSVVLCSAAMAETGRIVSYEPTSEQQVTSPVQFVGDEPQYPGGFFDSLQQYIEALGEARNLKVEVVVFEAAERMSAAERVKWGSAQGLAQKRADSVVAEIEKRLNLPGTQFVAKVGEAGQGEGGVINVFFDKPVYAQAEQLAPTAPSADEQAKAALAVTEEDENQNTLEDALTAVDENYSLIREGQFGLQYSYNFTYSSADSILLGASSGGVSGAPIDVARDTRFTYTSTFSGSYGLKNNLTLGVNIPFVSSVRSGNTSQQEVEDDGIGDLSVSLRWQPWPVRLGKVNTTIATSLSLPVGTSPYEIDTENSVPLGSGTYGMSVSANFSKTIDPVIAYGSVSLSGSAPVDGLNQCRNPPTCDRFLTKVSPKPSLAYSIGMGYALSYGVSLNMGFQHSIAAETELEFSDRSFTTERKDIFESIGGHSAMFNVSAGFRTAPGTVLSINLGMGLTRESPDFVIGFYLPFSVEGLKSYFTGYDD